LKLKRFEIKRNLRFEEFEIKGNLKLKGGSPVGFRYFVTSFLFENRKSGLFRQAFH
jgi:hypothetical protein